MKRGSTWGTSHFVSLAAAYRYYKGQEHDRASVDQKIREGEIHIGKPVLKPGEKLVVLDEGTRYGIQEAQR